MNNDNIENLILERLKAMHADIGDIKRDVHEVKMRMGSLESHLAAVYGDVVRHSARLEELDERLLRVEKRLELRDAP